MTGVPTLLRVWLMGTFWGTACGVVSAWLIALVLAVNGGARADGIGDLLVSVALVAYLAAFYGGVVGFIAGCAVGCAAGILLTAMLRVATPRAAARTTIGLVLVGQVVVAMAYSGAPTWSTLWAYAAVPVVSVIPLTVEARKAALDTSAPVHRDTLTA